MTDLSPTGIRTGYDLNVVRYVTRMLELAAVGYSFLLSDIYLEDSNTWNLWFAGPVSRLEACTSGMRVGTLCKPHAGVDCSLGTPKHPIHVVVVTLSCISSDFGRLHPVMFAS